MIHITPSRLPERFSTNDEFLDNVRDSGIVLGHSEEGRPIIGFRLGTGAKRASFLAGAHADEPVGPETLRTLVQSILRFPARHQALLEDWTLCILPQINPDSEARNQKWIEDWPSLSSYLIHAFREAPGRDIEFSWPDRRIENRSVAKWLTENGPFHVHASLHGMGYSQGGMLLIERNWSYRTSLLQEGFESVVHAAGMDMHDHNRKGEKGFFYIAPGFTTTPEGAAMRTYFLSHGQADTAALFSDSSMEFVRSLGGDPLCVVTELPLFVVRGPSHPGTPVTYLRFREAVANVIATKEYGSLMARFDVSELDLKTAIAIQLRVLSLALETISSE